MLRGMLRPITGDIAGPTFKIPRVYRDPYDLTGPGGEGKRVSHFPPVPTPTFHTFATAIINTAAFSPVP